MVYLRYETLRWRETYTQYFLNTKRYSLIISKHESTDTHIVDLQHNDRLAMHVCGSQGFNHRN